MKIRLFVLFFSSLLFLSRNICAQTNEFAPLGAKWWYSVYEVINGPEIPEVKEVIKDTMIDLKLCKLINSSLYEDGLYSEIIIYQKDEMISQYFSTEGLFKTIIDFSKDFGESYFIYGTSVTGIDSMLVTVTSFEMIDIGGTSLRKQEISHDGYFDWGEINIEKLGNNGYMVPHFSLFEIVPGPLRCYEDEEIGHYESGIVEDCNIVINNITNKDIIPITVYPSIIYGHFTVFNPQNQSMFISMFSNLGSQLFSLESNSQESIFNLEEYASGNYYLQINTNNTHYSFNLLKM